MDRFSNPVDEPRFTNDCEAQKRADEMNRKVYDMRVEIIHGHH